MCSFTGSRLRLAGEGEGGSRNGPPGDLYVVLRVEDHPFFQRQDDDVYCRVPITFPQAALGTEIDVPTIDGTERLRVPERTQTGTILKLRGKGIPRVRGMGRGDQLVEIMVVTPRQLTKEQRKLYKKLQELTPSIPLDMEGAERNDRSFIEKLFG